ncbi:MAG: penicillin-binding protein 2 [Candidatus Aminicenantes bacterium]|nr:penicillin-binding protein 2 [Candidatus Aminicenantes bacterium]
MKNSKIYEDFVLVLKRSKKIFILIHVLIIFLLLNFWKIQVLDHKKYWEQSEANRMREIVLPSQRGLIKDRWETILADNKASFKVSIIREDCEDYDKSCRKISRLLKIEEGVLKERIRKYESFPIFKPIVVKENLSFEEVAVIEARKLEFPELFLQAEPKRFYPFGSLAAHALGYIQELSEEEIKNGLYQQRRLGDLIGKTGVEKVYEATLVGTDGRALEIVDSVGRTKGEMAKRDPQKGQNLILTLDYALQEKAEELLEGREGAVVMMDPQTGEILALASYPTFDPNKFIDRFTPDEWLDLVSSLEFPLENRAIRGQYAPGSVFKLVVDLGALELGIVDEETTFTCKGEVEIYNEPFVCWVEKGHGEMSLIQGIRNSCNIYHYQVGKKMGIEEISRYAKMLRFGARTGIDLPGEKIGLVPDPQWKWEVRNERWQPGETISVSIGQGPLLVTPIQVALYTSIIANRGRKVTPHLLNSQSQIGNKIFAESNTVEIEPSTFETVIQGMWEVVNNGGTGWAANVKGFDICGKTGSTQLISTEKDEEKKEEKEEEEEEEIKTHSWFTGFAPRDNPKIVVTVLVEYGGMGGATAAPLSKQLFNLYRRKYD